MWRRRSTTRRSSGTSIGCSGASCSSSRSAVRLTRRQALAGAATGALGAAGVYELVDPLAGPPPRPRRSEGPPPPPAQHGLRRNEAVGGHGVAVGVPAP